MRWDHLSGNKRKHTKPEEKVGKYHIDYSELTPEELAQPDPELDNLIADSRPK